MRFYRNAVIEARADARLAELAAKLGKPIAPPIPIDRVAEDVFDLSILWDDIEEYPGETVLGGLDVDHKRIVINDRHRDLFDRKPGLERSTKGHEMGHWDLFVNRAMLGQPTLLGLDAASLTVRRSGLGEVRVIEGLLRNPEIVELLYRIQARSDSANEARAVNRYAAALSMPRSLILGAFSGIDPMYWPDPYDFAKQFDVTITALNVRLEQLGLSYVQDSKHIHRSKAIAAGQMMLGEIDSLF